MPVVFQAMTTTMMTQMNRISIPDRLFFRIGDVARLLQVKPHVLRYWETEFNGISPQKSATGQRVYKRTEVETLVLIKELLYNERYSIEGAKKRLRELRREGELTTARKGLIDDGTNETLKEAKELVKEIQTLAKTPVSAWFAT